MIKGGGVHCIREMKRIEYNESIEDEWRTDEVDDKEWWFFIVFVPILLTDPAVLL